MDVRERIARDRDDFGRLTGAKEPSHLSRSVQAGFVFDRGWQTPEGKAMAAKIPAKGSLWLVNLYLLAVGIDCDVDDLRLSYSYALDT